MTQDKTPVMSMAYVSANPMNAESSELRCATAMPATTSVIEFPIVSRRTGSQRSQPHFCV